MAVRLARHSPNEQHRRDWHAVLDSAGWSAAPRPCPCKFNNLISCAGPGGIVPPSRNPAKFPPRGQAGQLTADCSVWTLRPVPRHFSGLTRSTPRGSLSLWATLAPQSESILGRSWQTKRSTPLPKFSSPSKGEVPSASLTKTSRLCTHGIRTDGV